MASRTDRSRNSNPDPGASIGLHVAHLISCAAVDGGGNLRAHLMPELLRRIIDNGPTRRRLLLCLGILGMVVAWSLYPSENRYSPMRCTISYLGSPDADRNPAGWRIYQAGMTALLLWMADLLVLRHRRCVRNWASLSGASSVTLALGLVMILVTVWIPDSRSGHWFGMTSGQFHTRIALWGIPILAMGVVLDAFAYFRAGGTLRSLWPFHLYAGISALGFHQLMEWERLCREDRSLRHWPGDGLHSTPLWEWIFFVGLMLVWCWMARRRQPGWASSGT